MTNMVIATNLMWSLFTATNALDAAVTTMNDVFINQNYNVRWDDYDLTIPTNAMTVEIVTNQSPPMLEYESPQWQIPWGTNVFLNAQDVAWPSCSGTVKAKTIRFDEVRRKTLRFVWLKKERTMIDEEVLKSWNVRYELKTQEQWIETTNAVPKVSDITDYSLTNTATMTALDFTIASTTNEALVTISHELIDALIEQIEKRKTSGK